MLSSAGSSFTLKLPMHARFWLNVHKQLLASVTAAATPRAGRRTPTPAAAPQTHTPIMVEKSATCRGCRILKPGQRSKETKFKCQECDVYLCIKKNSQCWTAYHEA
mmetsp:Transcript_28342/g.37070  ORF Transcript_28342/g.37070 Transcript_28342/m.37070 type:complete len:106 (+) Transcript_28342:76-393(+)